MDLFEKCEKYTTAKDIQKLGLYPYFHALQSRQDVEVIMEGKRRIMLGSNNYLGLTTHPDVVEAGIKAYEQYGSGCSGSRFLNGTLALHIELEKSPIHGHYQDKGHHGYEKSADKRDSP